MMNRMEEVEESQIAQESSVSVLSPSTSSYYSFAKVFSNCPPPDHHGMSPPATGPLFAGKRQALQENKVDYSVAGLAIERLRFIDHVAVNGGMAQYWKDIEERFDRLASTRNGFEPVLKCSDFGFCIGMQQNPEFSNELLRALRGRRTDGCDEITKSQLQNYWCRIIDPCFDSRIRIFFDLCNRNMDGRIAKMEIKQVIMLSASTNKLSISQEEAEEYAALIMEELDSDDQGYIELSQLETLFKESKSEGSLSTDQIKIITRTPNHNDPYQEPLKSKAEILFRTYWRRVWIILCWLTICFSLFTWKFIQYGNRKAFEVMGYCLCTAKGAAETVKFNMALILLPVCRNTITWLRKSHRISSVIPFNDNINFHKVIAGGIMVGVILHGGSHLACDFPRISTSNRVLFQKTIAADFGDHQPSYIQILATTEVSTGIVMVIMMSIAFLLATNLPRRQSPSLPKSVRRVTGFNAFWYSHHLFMLVYALLIIHSLFLFLTNDPAEKTTWMYIVIPVLLYAGERIFRAIRSGLYEVEILMARTYPGKVLSLKMQKPQGFKYQSGMYIFIQCPQISQFEWHPFSLTSGPEDDHLSVHIRTLGDWSFQIHGLFQEAILSRLPAPKIYIDGPYGAPTQYHVKYDIVMLIGLGIGATPFISVLKDIANGLQKSHFDHVSSGEPSTAKYPTKAYLYWVTREQGSFDWFRDVMKDISKTSRQKEPMIEMHNYLTSIYEEGDARSALISAIQALHHAKNGIDIVSRTPVRTHFARPNWLKIFSNLARRHGGVRIGVFYCGPSVLGRELERLCTKVSTKTTTRFVFHKENY